MKRAAKKISIAIALVLFAISICLPFFIIPSKVYADSVPYEIGDTGPAGGIIFYIDGSYHLEAATSDIGPRNAVITIKVR